MAVVSDEKIAAAVVVWIAALTVSPTSPPEPFDGPAVAGADGDWRYIGRDIGGELAALRQSLWFITGAGGLVFLLGLAGGWWASTRTTSVDWRSTWQRPPAAASTPASGRPPQGSVVWVASAR